ncbi:MAG: hypothetical protein H7A35_04225 [Planctomycetales bacterium]|nr:hypothetical protein [bacterium]UNM09263.1 MAG: hypothetical protein H7A35_04225 [Planctomycetales bacterium]
MSAVTYQTVLSWLEYWAQPAKDSYKVWEDNFDSLPPPPGYEFRTYEEAALWISTNYTGGPVPNPPTSSS